ncbi:MAG TPA: FAD-dependent oxidoreductase [Thermoanaerobaculia bacterium]|nr:FAD-dependent oxidoreductase [Thermoanaerobaculia bacterium]
MRERQDIILGGGLAGLTAAYTFQQAGEDHWQVYEREERVGGLARTIEVEGYKFDYGPHILFTIDSEMEALIRELLGENFHAQQREAWIYHQAHDLYTQFPFQAHLHGLPVPIVEDCLVGLVRAVEGQARGEFHPANYEEWMRGFFGEGIAEHLMIPYAKKIWTVEPATMDFSWIGRRVPTPQVDRIVRGALTADVELVGATSKFWYPKSGGIEPLPRALGRRVENLHFQRTAERIELPERRVVFADGEVVPFEHLVYTLPLPFLPRFVADLPPEVERACAALRYQGIYCVNLGIDRERISDKHWVYFYEEPFPFHRLSFPANFSPDTAPPGKSSISTEVAFSEWRPLERDQAVERTLAALRLAGILTPDDTVELVHTEEILPAYVIYDLDHPHNVATIRDWLREHGIHTAGRFGEWQYFNMDHSMRSGKSAAEAILATRRGATTAALEAGP